MKKQLTGSKGNKQKVINTSAHLLGLFVRSALSFFINFIVCFFLKMFSVFFLLLLLF